MPAPLRTPSEPRISSSGPCPAPLDKCVPGLGFADTRSLGILVNISATLSFRISSVVPGDRIVIGLGPDNYAGDNLLNDEGSTDSSEVLVFKTYVPEPSFLGPPEGAE